VAGVGIQQQSEEITLKLPRLMRRLFRIDSGDPSAELPVAQVRVCSILMEGARSMTCISKELGTSLSAATQLADRLEKAGMVERVPEADDRRVKSLQLTEQGNLMMQKRLESRIERVTKVLEQLPAESRKSIIDAVDMFMDACASASQDQPECNCSREDAQSY
jgi:DNA-binding MarR family transcriptional regulator